MLQSLGAGLVQLSERVVSGSSTTVMSPAGRECKFIQVLEMLVPVMDGNGGQPGFHHDAVGRRPVEGCQGLGIRGAVTKGEAVPEGPESFLLLAGEDAVAHCLGDSLPEALLQGPFDALLVGAGALGDGPQGLPEGSLVEGMGAGRLGGELRHLLDAGLVGLSASSMGALQEAGWLVAVSAAVQGLEDSGDGHLYPSYRFFRKAFGRARSLRARSISVRRPATTWSPTTEVQKSLPLSGRVLRTNPRHTGER